MYVFFRFMMGHADLGNALVSGDYGAEVAAMRCNDGKTPIDWQQEMLEGSVQSTPRGAVQAVAQAVAQAVEEKETANLLPRCSIVDLRDDYKYDKDSLYMQCSEIFTLIYEKLHTET